MELKWGIFPQNSDQANHHDRYSWRILGQCTEAQRNQYHVHAIPPSWEMIGLSLDQKIRLLFEVSGREQGINGMDLNKITSLSHQLAAKSLNQWANIFTHNSAVKIIVKNRFNLSNSTSQPFDDPSDGICVLTCASKTFTTKFCNQRTSEQKRNSQNTVMHLPQRSRARRSPVLNWYWIFSTLDIVSA